MPSNHLVFCHLLLLASIFPRIRVFSKEVVLCSRWPKYWNFSFSISPSNEYSRLISFRIDWFDLLAVQGTFKSFLQDPQFKSINSLVLSFLYYPTLTSIHDYICDFYIHTWLLDNTFLKLYILVTDYCSGYNLICFQRQHYITIASCSYFINFTSNDSHITLSLPSEFKEDQKFFWDPPRYNKSVSVLRVTLFGLVKLEKSFGSQRLVMLSFEFSQSHFFP